MGKQKAAKNKGVGLDFKRIKHKVGKKLAKPKNETNASFKSRKINLPNQSITSDKQGVAVSQRNQTLKELLSQTGHHNDKIRKDSVAGLVELLQQYPAEMQRNAGLVFETIAERLTDSEKVVRVAVQGLLRGSVFPNLQPGTALPFLPVLMAHLCSAMTHLSNAVRMDALAFLDILMDVMPQSIAESYMVACLQHFHSLLTYVQKGSSLKARSVGSVLKVVTGLASFLQRAFPAGKAAAALQGPGANGGGWPASSAPAPLFAARCCWPDDSNRPQHTKPGQAGLLHAPDAGQAAACAVSLLHIVLECWGVCAPGQLSSAPELEQCQALGHMLTAVTLLLDNFHLAQAVDTTDAVVRTVSACFPALQPTGTPPAALHTALVQFNLRAAELLARLMPQAIEESPWALRVILYYRGVLETGQLLPSTDALQLPDSNPGASAATYLPVLHSLGHFLPRLSFDVRSQLMAAVASLAARLSHRTQARAACLRLQRALLDQSVRTGCWLMSEEQLVGYLQPLPKLLWELGAKQPDTSLVALQLLHDAARTAVPGSTIATALCSLQAQLLPFFATAIPTKAAKTAGGHQKPETVLLGPLADLPQQHQWLAIDLLHFLGPLDPASLKVVVLMVGTDMYSEAAGLRALDVVMHGPLSDDPAALLSFALTLLALPGRSFCPAAAAACPVGVPLVRYQAVAAALCRHLRRLGDLRPVAGLLQDHLLQLWSVAAESPSPSSMTANAGTGMQQAAANAAASGVSVPRVTEGREAAMKDDGVAAGEAGMAAPRTAMAFGIACLAREVAQQLPEPHLQLPSCSATTVASPASHPQQTPSSPSPMGLQSSAESAGGGELGPLAAALPQLCLQLCVEMPPEGAALARSLCVDLLVSWGGLLGALLTRLAAACTQQLQASEGTTLPQLPTVFACVESMMRAILSEHALRAGLPCCAAAVQELADAFRDCAQKLGASPTWSLLVHGLQQTRWELLDLLGKA